MSKASEETWVAQEEEAAAPSMALKSTPSLQCTVGTSSCTQQTHTADKYRVGWWLRVIIDPIWAVVIFINCKLLFWQAGKLELYSVAGYQQKHKMYSLFTLDGLTALQQISHNFKSLRLQLQKCYYSVKEAFTVTAFTQFGFCSCHNRKEAVIVLEKVFFFLSCCWI